MQISRSKPRSLLLLVTTLLLLLPAGRHSIRAAPPGQAPDCQLPLAPVREWGGTGSGPGQFSAPVAIAVDWDGNVHVLDRDNRRVQKFDPWGNYLLEYGNEDGRVMINPNGLDVGRNGYMYIADTDQHRILYYTDMGQFIGGWNSVGESEWTLLQPWGVAGWDYNSQGNVYVVDRQTCGLLRFHSNGQFIDDWGHCDPAPYLPFHPQDMAVYPSRGAPPMYVYVADTGNNRIMRFNYRLEWDRNWTQAGATGDPFNQPGSVAVDTNGYVYVADSGSNKVQVFDPATDRMLVILIRHLHSPSGIAVGEDRYVYVADTGSNRIQVLCPLDSGQIIATIPPSGGELVSASDGTSYTFPAGTFTSTAVITHTPRLSSSAPVTGPLIGIDHFFEIAGSYVDGGGAAQPTGPYTLRVQYTDSELGAAIESSLALYHWSGTGWVMEPTSTVDLPNNTVTATPNHFSLWAVLGETRHLYLPLLLKNY